MVRGWGVLWGLGSLGFRGGVLRGLGDSRCLGV